MALKIVHIEKETIAQEASIRAFSENVLKPKWEAQARRMSERLFSKQKSKISSPESDGQNA